MWRSVGGGCLLGALESTVPDGCVDMSAGSGVDGGSMDAVGGWLAGDGRRGG